MRTVFKLIVVVAMMAATHLAWASYTFTMKLDISGSCGGWSSVERSTAQALFDRYVNSVNLGIPSRAECEQARQIIMSEINGIGSGSCKIRVVCGPCTGSGGMGDAPGVNLEGPSKGGSFYSGNASSEIRDWDKQNNALKQMLSGNSTNALPQNTWTASVYKNADSWIADGKGSQEKEFASNARNSKASGFVIDPDKPFGGIPQDMELVPLPAQKEKVSRWVSQVTDNEMDLLLSYPDKCEQTFQSLFREKTGIDINAIIQKPYFELTDDERQALGNYNEFLRQTVTYMEKKISDEGRRIVGDEGKQEIDAAILSEDCYNSSKHDYIGLTAFEKLSLKDMPKDNPLSVVARLIDSYNESESQTGFHADIYYNKMTDEYTLAFAGTDDFKDASVDYNNIFGELTSQYKFANVIGLELEKISNDFKINITGHSLGGGLASVCGLASGKPTITINAAGVTDDVLSNLNLLERKNNHEYKIKALVAEKDAVNYLQTEGVNSIYMSKNVGTLNNGPISQSQNLNVPALGDIKIVKNAGIHTVKPVVKQLLKQNNASQKTWSSNRDRWNKKLKGFNQLNSMMRTQLLKGENYERDN